MLQLADLWTLSPNSVIDTFYPTLALSQESKYALPIRQSQYKRSHVPFTTFLFNILFNTYFLQLNISVMTIKTVIFDMGGVLIPAPMTEWESRLLFYSYAVTIRTRRAVQPTKRVYCEDFIGYGDEGSF